MTAKDNAVGVGWDGEKLTISIKKENAEYSREEAMRLGLDILDKAINHTDPNLMDQIMDSQHLDIKALKTDNANITEELYTLRKRTKKMVEKIQKSDGKT
jgi:hypothetical protein